MSKLNKLVMILLAVSLFALIGVNSYAEEKDVEETIPFVYEAQPSAEDYALTLEDRTFAIKIDEVKKSVTVTEFVVKLIVTDVKTKQKSIKTLLSTKDRLTANSVAIYALQKVVDKWVEQKVVESLMYSYDEN